MTQFNLLPDVKLNFIKAQRNKRLVISISLLVTAVAIAILVIILAIVFWQKKSLGDLNRDISKYSAQISGTKDLNTILTIQNQLNSLPSIDGQKPDTNKLASYIAQITPYSVSYSDFNIDFTQNKIDVTGKAPDLKTVDQFVDTLKFADYTTPNNTAGSKVFSNVVLESFSIDQKATTPGSQASGASYEITADFDPAIFNSSQDAQLQIKSQVTTRSSINQPTDLFTGKPGS